MEYCDSVVAKRSFEFAEPLDGLPCADFEMPRHEVIGGERENLIDVLDPMSGASLIHRGHAIGHCRRASRLKIAINNSSEKVARTTWSPGRTKSPSALWP